MKLNPYRAVIGRFPSKQDYSEWSSDKWLDFLRYTEFHLGKKMDPKKKVEVERFVITHELMKDIESRLNTDTDPWLEFIWRTNEFLSENSTTPRYYKRISVFVRQALTWLKFHPARVSDEMKTLIETHPERMGWSLKQYFLKDTPQGEIVQRDEQIVEGSIKETTKLPSVQAKMMTSLVELVDLYTDLVKSVKKSHLASDLTTKDKLNAIPKLVDSIIKMSSKKASANHFTQINIHGGAREMEDAMLSYVKTKESE